MDDTGSGGFDQTLPDCIAMLREDPVRGRHMFLEEAYRELMCTSLPVFANAGERRHDLVVEVLDSMVAQSCRRLLAYEPRGYRFRTWFLVVARRCAIDVLRAQRPEPEEADYEQTASSDPSVDAGVGWRRLLELTTEAIRQLDPRCQFVLRARGEGWNNRDFSALLGLSNHDAGNVVRQCRQKLRQELEKLGIDLAAELSTIGRRPHRA